MLNGEDTSDVPGSEEHSNALGVLPTSLTEAIPDGHSIIPSRDEEERDDGASSSTESLAEAIPDPPVAQAGERIVAGPANFEDIQAPAQPNLIIGGLVGVVVGAHNLVIIGPPNADVVPAGVFGAHNAVIVGPHNGVILGAHNAVIVGAHNAGVAPAGQAPAQLNLGGAAAMVAPPHFDIEVGLSGSPLRRSEVGPFF